MSLDKGVKVKIWITVESGHRWVWLALMVGLCKPIRCGFDNFRWCSVCSGVGGDDNTELWWWEEKLEV